MSIQIVESYFFRMPSDSTRYYACNLPQSILRTLVLSIRWLKHYIHIDSAVLALAFTVMMS